MNLATVLIALAVAGLFGLAIRYLAKHGMCAACADNGACHKAQQAGGASQPSGCGGQCASCKYYEAELKAAARHRAGS